MRLGLVGVRRHQLRVDDIETLVELDLSILPGPPAGDRAAIAHISSAVTPRHCPRPTAQRLVS